jgi:hypothetical protein
VFPLSLAALLFLVGQSASAAKPAQGKPAVPSQPSYAAEADVVEQSEIAFRYKMTAPAWKKPIFG